MTQHVDKPTTEEGGVSRRTLVKGAAWSVPVIAVAIAAPSAAASTVAVNGFQVTGECGVLGLLGIGFDITAGSSPIPAGSVLTITTGGAVNLGVLTWNADSLLSVGVLSPGSVTINVDTEIPAGSTESVNTLLTVAVGATINASLSLPTGYVAGTGTKPSGGINTTLILCTGS